jgi:hypothetical protein
VLVRGSTRGVGPTEDIVEFQELGCMRSRLGWGKVFIELIPPERNEFKHVFISENHA